MIGPLEDNLQSVWNPWHVQRAILESDESLFHTRYLFYPQDFSLTMHTLSLTNAFFQAFLNLFFPLSYCYNLTLFLSFVLAGYFNFLLCYEFTQHREASFIGGLLFSFCPYHIARSLHHINLASIFWVPLLVFCIIRSFHYPHYSYYWKITLVYLLIVFTDYYYFLFAVGLGGIFALANWKKSKYLLMSLLFTFLLFFPVVLWTLSDLKTFHYPVNTVYDRGILDFMSFFVPPPWHSVWGKLSLHYFYNRLNVNPWEMVGYLGYFVLGFAIYGWIQSRSSKEIRLLGWIGFFSLILALGSPIHIFGKSTIPGFYWITKYFPLLGIIRVPSRWIVISHLVLSVFASFGIMKWLERKKNKKWSCMVLVGILFFEYSCIPLPYSKVSVSSFYEKIAKDTERYAILNIPYRIYPYSNYYMYLQTVHGKPILFGQVSRVYREAYRFLVRNHLDQFCQNFEITADQRELFRENQIRYLVVHKFLLEDVEKTQLKLNKEFDIFFEDQQIVVYHLK